MGKPDEYVISSIHNLQTFHQTAFF